MRLFGVFCLLILPMSCARAQGDKYQLQIDILIQPLPSHRLKAQAWGKALFAMGRRATFRSGRPGERTRVEDLTTNGRKTAKAVGIMNRDGSITFRKLTFRADTPQPLSMWLSKLEQYGPKGPPDEDSTWGLSDDEFTAVLKLLSRPVTEPVSVRSPVQLIDTLEVSPLFQVTFTDAARKRTTMHESEKPGTDFQGLSKGSVLAAGLSQFGLGFRPKVDDRGNFYLEVDAGNEADNLYPVGWKNTGPITLVCPELAKSIEVDLEDAPLDALITHMAQNLKRPHFYSRFELAAAGQDLTKTLYTRKLDKLTIHSLMNIVGRKHHLGLSMRTDEAGNVFLWITTEDDYNAFKQRFSHVIPKP